MVHPAAAHDVVAVVYGQHGLGRALIQRVIVADLLRREGPAVYAYVRHVYDGPQRVAYAHPPPRGIGVRPEEVDRAGGHAVHVDVSELRVPHRAVVYHERHTVSLSCAEAGRHRPPVAGHEGDRRGGDHDAPAVLGQVHDHRVLVAHQLGGELHLEREALPLGIERQRGDAHLDGRPRVNLQGVVDPSAAGVPREAAERCLVRPVRPRLPVRVAVRASHGAEGKLQQVGYLLYLHRRGLDVRVNLDGHVPVPHAQLGRPRHHGRERHGLRVAIHQRLLPDGVLLAAAHQRDAHVRPPTGRVEGRQRHVIGDVPSHPIQPEPRILSAHGDDPVHQHEPLVDRPAAHDEILIHRVRGIGHAVDDVLGHETHVVLAVGQVQRVHLVCAARLIGVGLHHRRELAVIHRGLQYHMARALHVEGDLHVRVVPHVVHRTHVVVAPQREVEHAVGHGPRRRSQRVLSNDGDLYQRLAVAYVLVGEEAHPRPVGVLRRHLFLHASAEDRISHVHALHRGRPALVGNVERELHAVSLGSFQQHVALRGQQAHARHEVERGVERPQYKVRPRRVVHVRVPALRVGEGHVAVVSRVIMQDAYLPIELPLDVSLHARARERTLVHVVHVHSPIVGLALYLVRAVFLFCHVYDV